MKMHASGHATRVAMMALTMILLVACGKGGDKAQVGQRMPPSLLIQNATASLPGVSGVSSDTDRDTNDMQADDRAAVTDAVFTGSHEELRAIATASRHYAIYVRYLAEIREANKSVDMQQTSVVTGNLSTLNGGFACHPALLGM